MYMIQVLQQKPSIFKNLNKIINTFVQGRLPNTSRPFMALPCASK